MDRKDLQIKALAEQVGALSVQLADCRAECTIQTAQARRLGESEGFYTIDGRLTNLEVNPKKEGANGAAAKAD